MVTQELLDYIRKKQENGISRVQIEKQLISQGWKKEDIDKGFYAYKLLISPQPKNFVSKRKTNKTARFMFLFLFLLTLAFVIYYLSLETIYLDHVKSFINQNISTLISKSDQSSTTDIKPTPTQSISPDLSQFLDNLEKCIPDNLEFTHPITADLLQKQIVEFVDDKCTYREEMPNDGLMECFYSLEELPLVSKYYRQAELSNILSFDINSDNQNQESDNLLQNYLDNGTCIISGYQD